MQLINFSFKSLINSEEVLTFRLKAMTYNAVSAWVFLCQCEYIDLTVNYDRHVNLTRYMTHNTIIG